MKASNLKVGMLVAVRKREYYQEPAAFTVVSDTPKVRGRWTGALSDCASWKHGGVLIAGDSYSEVRKLSQIVPHAEAVAEYQRQKAVRDAAKAVIREQDRRASALCAELQAMAPNGVLIKVDRRALSVTASGCVDVIRKLLTLKGSAI